MPRLLLLRHAKAERAGRASARDSDRVLSERGVRDAVAVGRTLARRKEHIEMVLCSSSVRTRQTWDGVRQGLANPPEPKFMREIYEGQASYLDILRNQADGAGTLLLIGHNPTIQETATLLASDLAGQDGAALRSHFPTAALVILHFDGAWPDLSPGAARLAAFLQPSVSEHD